MQNLNIAAAQFEHRSGDKTYNLSVIESLASEAAQRGASLVAFHECSITGYTFVRHLTKEQLFDIAEFIPDGRSTQHLISLAKKYHIAILAGLFEKDERGDIYKAYVCVNEKGFVTRHRKIHPFINPNIKPGNEFTLFELNGWTCGILICYDNNVIENVRATALLGADIIFMPHVTMCTPSTRPGAGFVDPQLWHNRHEDPTSLRLEFDGMKGRAWLMKWLPARAYDNGIYVVFSNAIGMDDDQLKNGCSMIIDPFGDIIAECRKLDNDITLATCIPGNLEKSGGYRYRNARKPELYGEILGQSNVSSQKVAWMNQP